MIKKLLCNLVLPLTLSFGVMADSGTSTELLYSNEKETLWVGLYTYSTGKVCMYSTTPRSLSDDRFIDRWIMTYGSQDNKYRVAVSMKEDAPLSDNDLAVNLFDDYYNKDVALTLSKDEHLWTSVLSKKDFEDLKEYHFNIWSVDMEINQGLKTFETNLRNNDTAMRTFNRCINHIK